MMPGYDSLCCFRSPNSSSGKRVLWEINVTCNLNCEFCHVKGEKTSAELGRKEIETRLELLKRVGVTEIIFSGGEPLLRADIVDILTLAKSWGFSIDLCTNGVLVDENIAMRLKHVLSEISVSLDSARASHHDRIRGQGAHQCAVRGIKLLNNAGLEVHAISLITKENFQDIEMTVKFTVDLGVQSITLLGRMATCSGEPSVAEIIGHDRLKETIFQIRSSSDIPINSKRLFFESTDFECPAGETVFGIDVKGRLLPCIIMKDQFFDHNLKAWHADFEIDRQAKCFHCIDLPQCGGGCPGASSLRDGVINVDLLCPNVYPRPNYASSVE